MQEEPETLPRCEYYWMDMPSARIFKHRQIDKCNKDTERRLQQIDMEMVDRCVEMEFSMDGEDGEYGDKRVEGVGTFRYLRRTLDQTDDDWPEVRRNIMNERLVWGKQGILLWRKGADLSMAEIFYRTVVQEILLYGLETWVPLAEVENKVEGAHIGLLRQIKRKRARRIGYETLETP